MLWVVIVITGAIQTTTSTYDELLRLSREHVARSRAEPGCLSHEVAVSCDDPLRLVFVECWADAEAVRAHFALPASRGFAAAGGRLGTGTPSLAVYAATPVDPRAL